MFYLFSSRPSLLPLSDYIIKEKTVLLQKKDNEGFGFVLRGAKGELLIQNHHIFLFPFFLISLSLTHFFKPMLLLSVSTHAHTFVFILLSSDSHRGVHSNASVSRAAVPGVCWWGGCGVEGGPEDGGFPHRGKNKMHYGLKWDWTQSEAMSFSKKMLYGLWTLKKKKHFAFLCIFSILEFDCAYFLKSNISFQS